MCLLRRLWLRNGLSIDATVLVLLCEVDDSLITFVALTPFRYLALGLCQEARLELGAFGVVDSLLGGSLGSKALTRRARSLVKHIAATWRVLEEPAGADSVLINFILEVEIDFS